MTVLRDKYDFIYLIWESDRILFYEYALLLLSDKMKENSSHS